MDIFYLVLAATTLISSGYTQVVEHYPQKLTVGEEAVISCSDGNKPPGVTSWDYGSSNVRYTELCQVVLDDGILEERADCYGDSGIGNPANFTFTIRSVSWNHTFGDKWKCLMYSDYKVLSIGCDDITVVPADVEYTGSGTVERNQFVQLTAKISCHYPLEEVVWCIQINDEEPKCSDSDDDSNPFYKDVFHDLAIEPQKNETCDEYEGCLVGRVSSTIRGTTVKQRMKTTEIRLFAKVGNNYYELNALAINLQNFEGGEIAGITIVVLLFVIPVPVVVFCFINKKKKKSDNFRET